jgi:chromosome condensin MukBEF ATPase and DNA-binding subunit MukB
MVYEEYYKKYQKYKDIKKEINRLENKKISLMGMVDVQSVAPKNGTGTNKKEDKMLYYTGELEETELEIEKQKKILKEVEEQLKKTELELRKSNEMLDKVYLYKYVEHLKYYQISIKIGYEKTKTYELINEIKNKLGKIKKSAEKNGKN